MMVRAHYQKKIEGYQKDEEEVNLTQGIVGSCGKRFIVMKFLVENDSPLFFLTLAPFFLSERHPAMSLLSIKSFIRQPYHGIFFWN